MRAKFPLFQSHLDLTKELWERVVEPTDICIDATCGNGNDTLFLAEHTAKVYALDIQSEAIKTTEALLKKSSISNVELLHQSHETLPSEDSSIKLIVYNLGYLPGGDKSLTTFLSSTLKSVEQALEKLVDGGVLSITCYPGHLEGDREMQGLLEFFKTLDPRVYSCTQTTWINRCKAPSLILIQKSLSS